MLYILLIYISDLKLAELENSDVIFDKIKSLNSIKDFEEVNLLKVETFDENVYMWWKLIQIQILGSTVVLGVQY